MEEINLEELFDYFKSKIVWIIITIICVLIIGNIYSFFIRKPIYTTSTTVLLVGDNQSTQYTTSELTLNQKLVSTYSEIIKSRKVLEKVNYNLGYSYTASDLQKMISVSSVKDTEVIKITISTGNQNEAANIADEIAKVFIEEVKDKFNLSNVDVLDTAVTPLKPSNENYLKDNVIYTGIGLVGSLAVLFICFYFDTTIKNSEVLEKKYGLVVLGIVPLEKGGK